MTDPYVWNPMPHVVEIACPSCGGSAAFEFAECARITLRRDIPFFQKNPLFEYHLIEGSSGGKWHAAFFFPGLHARDTSAIRDLPDGYSPSDWNHSKYLYRSHGTDWGTATCSRCGLKRRHQLAWPQDARFQIQYRGRTLWAFNRESARELRDYVASDDRDRSSYSWRAFLMEVPKEFLTRAARPRLVQLLDRLLST